MQPRNLTSYEYFAYQQLFLMFLFLQSHVVFGTSRAMAMLDGIKAPHDTPVSYLRSTASIRTFWNKFHVSWRNFFATYIYHRHKSTALGAMLCFAFASVLHGFDLVWYPFFASMCALYFMEGWMARFRWFKHPTHFVFTIKQTAVLVAELHTFPFLAVVNDDVTRKFSYSSRGLIHFALLNLIFSYLNSRRLAGKTDSFL